MSLSSESGSIIYSDIIVNGISNEYTQEGTQENCVDLFILFRERDEYTRDPGTHIYIPLERAKELARDLYNTAKIAEDNLEAEKYGPVAGRKEYEHD